MSQFTFTRLSNDNCALDTSLKQSTSPFDWNTDASVKESNKSCFEKQTPFMHNQFYSVPKDTIDFESELFIKMFG